MPLARMLGLGRLRPLRLGRLVLRLVKVAVVVEPAQVAELVIVAALIVVALSADAVTTFGVPSILAVKADALAPPARSILRGLDSRRPVLR